uniref:Thymidylate synthase n=1 Tax=Haemonchus placei TaxID=6290 RepID=A0A0N4VV01_HAEPC
LLQWHRGFRVSFATQADCFPYSLRRVNVELAVFKTPFFERIGISNSPPDGETWKVTS